MDDNSLREAFAKYGYVNEGKLLPNLYTCDFMVKTVYASDLWFYEMKRCFQFDHKMFHIWGWLFDGSCVLYHQECARAHARKTRETKSNYDLCFLIILITVQVYIGI